MTDISQDTLPTSDEKNPGLDIEASSGYLDMNLRSYGNIPVLTARGDLDISTVSSLWGNIESCVADLVDSTTGSTTSGNSQALVKGDTRQISPKPIQAIVLDLGDVAFIDSAGLALLVEARRRFAEIAHFVLMVKSQTQPERVLRLCRFDAFFPIIRAVEELDAVAPGNCAGTSCKI